MSILLCVCDFQAIGRGSKVNQLSSPKHHNMRKIGVGVNAQMVQNSNMEKRQWSEKCGPWAKFDLISDFIYSIQYELRMDGCADGRSLGLRLS